MTRSKPTWRNKQFRLPFGLYRVAGRSMVPGLEPGKLVLAWRRTIMRPGDIVVFHHDTYDKVKRIAELNGTHMYVLGDNMSGSTDSRHFGWLPIASVVGTVVWPRNRR